MPKEFHCYPCSMPPSLILLDYVYTLIKIFPIRLDIPEFSDRLDILILVKVYLVHTTILHHLFRKDNRIHYLVPCHLINLRQEGD